MATELIAKLKTIYTTKAIDASIGAYAANDVVNNDDCSTTATCWTFSQVAKSNGRFGYIVGATIVSESESIVPKLTLYLFKAVPTSQLTDNSANTAPDAADKLNYLGKIDFPALESLGTTDSTATVPSVTNGILRFPFNCAAGDDDLYGILVTRDIFTQTATDDLTIILNVEQY